MAGSASLLSALPSVDRLLRHPEAQPLLANYGRASVTDAVRSVLAALRTVSVPDSSTFAESTVLQRISQCLEAEAKPTLRPVFNLTGTILHTNLGRAQLPEEAIEAMISAAREPCNLEYDLSSGTRGDRDRHIENILRRLTGAEAATVVNNNAAALLLTLNTLANRREVPVSRGELIEIGGSFRLPDIMVRSGCRLREVGTTNRTHLADFDQAIGSKTGAVLKVHTSNYAIEGFTAAVAEDELASLCRERRVPFIVDLGSGTLLDLRRFNLPHEPTPTQALARGADVVTFSGDKLLGGPQAGIIVGRSDLVAKVRRNPLKRALRVDKLTTAALSAVLRLYGNPERLVERLPTLRLINRPVASVRATAERVLPFVAKAIGEGAQVSIVDCKSEIGSGAAPTHCIPSAGVAIRPGNERLASKFRGLAIPIIGRLKDDAFILDLRCLEDEVPFLAQLAKL